MKPVTKVAIGAVIALILASGVAAAAAAGFGGRLFGESSAGTQGTTARFTGSGDGSVSTSGVPVAGVATGGGAQLTGAGAAGTAASTRVSEGTSVDGEAPGVHAGGSTTASVSASAPSAGTVAGVVGGMVQPITSAASGALPFSVTGDSPILGLDVTSNGRSVASVP